MGYHKQSGDSGYPRHEIKTFHRKGDQVRSEYERLNPDGTVTKSVAYGDCREGLRYRTFHMGLDGSITETAPEQFMHKPVTAAPQQQQVAQQPQPAAQQQQAPQQAPQQPPQQPPRKAFAFIVEPKTNDPTGWRLRPLNIVQQEKTAEPIAQKVEPATQQDEPWWYETLKEAFREPKEEKIPEKPAPLPEPEKKVGRNIFDLFDNDFFSFSPFRKSIQPPRYTNPFDMLSGDSFFDRPLLGFSRSLLDDF